MERGTLMKAQIMKAAGGADAIATMTFDDGKVRTAEKLNELLKKYDAKASLMLISDLNAATDEQICFWRDILSEGYLSAESHSATHDYLTSNPRYTKPEHLCEEKYLYETRGAYEKLKAAFPEQDLLAFTIPYANYLPDARKKVITTYYAALSHACALTTKEYEGRCQSLDPAPSDPKTGEAPAGSWHCVYYSRLQPIYSVPRVDKGETKAIYPQLSMENIIGYLDKCVKESGWFITSAHGIFPGENQDLSVEDMELLLSAMSEYKKKNKLWIATFSEAVKYVRERQGAHLEYTEVDGGCTVRITLDDKTPEGLSLSPEVFNYPLTVKLLLPDGAFGVTSGGNTNKSFTEDGKTYAYVEVIPNGETVTYCYI